MPIAMTANRNDEEPWRLGRLVEVRDEVLRLKLPVNGLHDHKGTLYVNWDRYPSTCELYDMTKIWRDLQNEVHCNHYAMGAVICQDVYGDNPFGPADP